MESRRKGTRLLAEAIASLSVPPEVMVSASAVGYYGHRGNELLREDGGPGSDFLAEVCEAWEAAADPAREAGIRVVHPRFGLVLSPQGGALGTTLPIFKLGGEAGSGAAGSGGAGSPSTTSSEPSTTPSENDSVEGPVNVGSPNPLTNAQYTKVLKS